MQEEVENKSVMLIINSTKFTGRVLKSAISKYLAHRSEKRREKKMDRKTEKHAEQAKRVAAKEAKKEAKRNVIPRGKQSVKDLIAQNQGVEKTELADRAEVKTFDHIARQYGVDYAIKKGMSPEGKQRYILFFKARDRSAIDQAMSAYAASYVKKHKQEHPPIEQVADPFREMLPGRKKDRVREKGLQR